MKSALQAKNLHKHYGKGAGKVVAVDGISLDVASNDIILIMGPSGSGKTTLLTMLGSLLTPDSGDVYYGDKMVTELPANKLASERAKHLGFVFQSFNLMPSLNAWENVAVVLELTGKNRLHAKKQAEKVLTKLGLGKRLDHRMDQLSGGEKQRVAIARALAMEPSVILADEPTANLDSKNGREVVDLLCKIACSENKAVIIVSHDRRIRDSVKRIFTIEDGKLIREEQGGHDTNCPDEHKIQE
jgi:putative ABC transport system ATP-binding protein